jgi:hypothetical protein
MLSITVLNAGGGRRVANFWFLVFGCVEYCQVLFIWYIFSAL